MSEQIKYMKNQVKMLLIAAAVATAQIQVANAQFTVPGTADPLLPNVGDSDDYNPGNGNLDTTPAQSSVLFGTVTPGSTISWNATGSTGNTPTISGYDANGDPSDVTGFAATPSDLIFIPTGNFSTFQAPINSLVGIFIGSGGADFIEMGSGGSAVVPAGADEFYMGSMDGYQWNNNSGAFNVYVTESAPDGGMTIGLLGGAIVALQAIRRKLVR